MKDKNIRKAVLNTSAIFLLIIGVMIYFYLKDPNRNYLYYQFEEEIPVVVAKVDIIQGDVITEDNVEVLKVKNGELLTNKETFVSTLDDLLGKKALYPFKSGQVLPSYYLLGKEDWYEGKHEYAIEVDIPSTVANSIKIGDYVDINISYSQGIGVHELYRTKVYDNFDIVISKVMIEDIKNGEGISYTTYTKDNPSSAFIPKYMKVSLDYNQIDNYLGAKEKGTVFLVKYDDITTVPNKQTYKVNSNKKTSPIEEEIIDTGETTNNDGN